MIVAGFIGKCRIKVILIACALMVLATAFPVCTGGDGWAQIISIAKKKAGGGGGPDAWYPTSAPCSWSESNEQGAALCEQITVGATGSLTKVSVYIVDKGSADIKIALYNSDGTSLLSSGGSIPNASISNGAYNEITLGTPVAVTASDIVMVCFRMSATVTYKKCDAATDAGRYASVTYALFPQSTINDEDSDAHCDVRLYVD